MTPPAPAPSRAEFLAAFGRIGLLSFGGPAAQIAVMHDELVTRRGWLSEDSFLRALSFCMMLPGPEAMQLAAFAGWRVRGTLGGIVAGLLFVLPGAFVMLALAAAYAAYGHVPTAEALFAGVKSVVVVVVVMALARLGRKALKAPDRWILAALAFAAITAFGVPFPWIVAAAALYGALTAPVLEGARVAAPPPRHLLPTLAVWGGLWAAPLLALWAMGQTLLLQIGLFFSKLAVVTFGGAYAVLAYMSQEVVDRQGWLSAPAMLDGLGLAETTPGPLILVTEFVGYQAAVPLGPWGGVAGAALVLWVTFVPCFLWIFAGAPYLDWLSTRPRLSAALQAVTAAVVGVIASLAFWFALHVFFGALVPWSLGPLALDVPVWSTVALWPVALAGLAAVSLVALKRGLLETLALVAMVSLGVTMLP